MRCLYMVFISGVKAFDAEDIGKRNTQKEAIIRNLSRVGWKDCYMLEKPTDSLIETLNAKSKDCYSNIYKVLEIAGISPLASTEAEREESVIRRLKTV